MRPIHTALAAFVVSALAAAPFVTSAALATGSAADAPLRSTLAASTPVAAPAERPAVETCARKVRVVYAGYASAPSACTETR